MVSDKVWEILEEQDIVPAPTLPNIEKIVKKARDKQCSIQINYPSDPDAFVLAIVTRAGQTFSSEQGKGVEAVAVALAECLTQTEPVQTNMFDEESNVATSKSVFDQVDEHLAGVEDDPSDTTGETSDEPAADEPSVDDQLDSVPDEFPDQPAESAPEDEDQSPPSKRPRSR